MRPFLLLRLHSDDAARVAGHLKIALAAQRIRSQRAFRRHRAFAEILPSPSTQNLTAREVEILCWVDSGKRNTEIASILGLSVHTIRKHLENIFAKLGVETRTAAAAAMRNDADKRSR